MAHACVRLLAGVLSSCFAARHMELFEHADKIEKAALTVCGEPFDVVVNILMIGTIDDR